MGLRVRAREVHCQLHDAEIREDGLKYWAVPKSRLIDRETTAFELEWGRMCALELEF